VRLGIVDLFTSYRQECGITSWYWNVCKGFRSTKS